MGRRWIYGLYGVASSLQQKMKFVDDDKVVELYGDSWIRTIDNAERALILEVQSPKTGETDIRGFEFLNMIEEASAEFLPLYFD